MQARCAIVNAGSGAWAFKEHALRLARALRVPVQEEPAEHSYLLGWDDPEPLHGSRLFIPLDAVRIAADKRLQAVLFARDGVPTPRTHLVDSVNEAGEVLRAQPGPWVLKWPTGCGAGGHRLLRDASEIPETWPRPFVVQEFIALAEPVVYRLYAAGGQVFGWNVRRFPDGVLGWPWVAHAQGARYESAGEAPPEAVVVAEAALTSAGLLRSFGCVDLLPAPDGGWLTLEVGTDGVYNHVDRNIGIPGLAEEIDARVGAAFHRWVQEQAGRE